MKDRKRLLSIDVGIKNLALCALVDDGNISEMLCIKFWRWCDVIDQPAEGKKKGKKTTERVTDVPGGTCEATLRKGKKVCGKPAKVLNASGKRVCGVHNPKTKHKPQHTQGWTWSLLKALPEIMEEVDREVPDLDEIVIEQQCVTNQKILLVAHLIYGHQVQR